MLKYINSKTSFIAGLIFGILILCTIGFFIVLGILLKDKGLEKDSANTNDAVVVQEDGQNIPQLTITKDDHVRGNKNASIVFFEYSDFECSFCARFHPNMKKLAEEFDDQIAWVYRHFPLRSIHQQAQPAAEASECVASLGGDSAFWKFIDELYDNIGNYSDALYSSLAREAGVDVKEFEACFKAGTFSDKVNNDYQSGLQNGVQGTPATFINGQLVPGAVSYEQLKTFVESQL